MLNFLYVEVTLQKGILTSDQSVKPTDTQHLLDPASYYPYPYHPYPSCYPYPYLGFFKCKKGFTRIKYFLAPDHEHKKVFHNNPVVWFCNGKNVKDHLVTAKLPNAEITEKSESSGKGSCLVCNLIFNTDTFFTKTCDETFKTQSGKLYCNFLSISISLKKYVR